MKTNKRDFFKTLASIPLFSKIKAGDVEKATKKVEKLEEFKKVASIDYSSFSGMTIPIIAITGSYYPRLLSRS